MAEKGDTKRSNTEDILEGENETELLLYKYHQSYFCQRVMFALHEKQLKFKSKLVNLLKGEQFSNSFLKLNPKAEVPVLQDGVKIIPDSTRIIDYLEDNFSNGDTPRLKLEKGTPQFQTMERLNGLIDKISISTLTYGCLYHPDLTEDMKFSPQEIASRLSALQSGISQLELLSKSHEEFKAQLETKKEAAKKRQTLAQDVEEVKKVLDDVGVLLDEVEKELESHGGEKENWWLCSEKFTIADIYLSVLLHRLVVIGLRKRYFYGGQHPKIAQYYRMVQKREAFRKTIRPESYLMRCVKNMGTKEKMYFSLGATVTIVGVMALVTFMVRNKK